MVLALAVTVVIGMIGSTLMVYATGNQQKATRSSFDSTAHGLAEAGINNAMSVLSNPSNNALNASLLPSSLETAKVDTYDQGYVKWWGTFDSTNSTWTLHSNGYMRNPTGSDYPVVRRITVQTKVRPSLMQPVNNPAWNYIMATRTGTAGGCDESLNNSVNLQAPLYVMGNLCMNTPSQITGGPLMVLGSVKLDVNTNIGSAAAPLNEVHVRNGCSSKGGAFASPCSPNEKVWATVSDANPLDLSAPTADFSSWYANAVPGPRQACTSQSGVVPVFDNDSAWNNSVPDVFNLTPGTSDYSCVVRGPAGNVVGQLSWDHTQKVLTIYGTVFIDGSVTAKFGSQNVAIQYDGQGTLYLSGTFLLSNTKLCAVITNNNCDFDSWNPNSDIFVIVSNGNGGQVPTGDSIQLVSSYFQGGLWAANAIELDTSSESEGPMVGGNVILDNSVNAWTWPAITVPTGMPGVLVVYAKPDPPSGYSS